MRGNNPCEVAVWSIALNVRSALGRHRGVVDRLLSPEQAARCSIPRTSTQSTVRAGLSDQVAKPRDCGPASLLRQFMRTSAKDDELEES
jgi:hypothetical protein